MLSFARGVYVALDLGAGPSWVRCLVEGEVCPAGRIDRQLAIDLAAGLADESPLPSAVSWLMRRGLVVRTERLEDPVIEQQLERLAAHWRWQLPRGRRGRLSSRLLRATRAAHAQRRIFLEAFGQTPCLPETAVRRALLVGVEPKRVLCLGDDDLVSLPLTLAGHSVVVHDIDDVVLLPLLRRIAAARQLDLRAERQDLCQPIPRSARGRFDVVFADPISTRTGLSLFISRALGALRPGGRLFCCVHAAAMRELAALQREMGFELAHHYGDFNHYYNDRYEEDLYRSDLVVLTRGADARPAIPAGRAVRADIFEGIDRARRHASAELRAPRGFVGRARKLRSAIESARHLSGLRQERVVEDGAGDVVSLIALQRGGGYVACSVDEGCSELGLCAFPHDAERDEAALLAVARHLPGFAVTERAHVARSLGQVIGPAGSGT